MEMDEVWAPVQWMVVAVSMVGLALVPMPVMDDSVCASVMMGSVPWLLRRHQLHRLQEDGAPRAPGLALPG